MKTYRRVTRVPVAELESAKFSVMAFHMGQACAEVFSAAQRDPHYLSRDIEVEVIIRPVPEPLPEVDT